MSRADYHQQHAERAVAEARRLLAEREAMGARWLPWVATELYRLSSSHYAAMVRRELERLAGG
ncbi:hypothetical protein NK553_13295 [Pseudomonas sp. ZM23]|uniref:Uncharacterized protein n=1 Tax=Pseudomonas triclosanedens TaxID=2961893 RepID=A0ABY7A2Z9_9PSED|nr:hypothetical protein [Pseudomonas triclosanedens]MCP8464923.1 hypothetical protein [Pseudomonas triclosanedens]MCP8470365.1 hypothetical protein [Pseudomonas triclosanedens]MCP8476170.1 hypothetical protein [Pseudomonas triclosanedens]WAI51597.1 hypothetical protein OU419_10220 [Pseudomonas triclosanedens]